jgi:hypothetical protein
MIQFPLLPGVSCSVLRLERLKNGKCRQKAKEEDSEAQTQKAP